jgi:hypothetical protein
MDEPYHRELHDILIRKGWGHIRVVTYQNLSYDHYYDRFNNMEIMFYEDDSITSFEGSKKMKIEDFDRITNGIFADQNGV